PTQSIDEEWGGEAEYDASNPLVSPKLPKDPSIPADLRPPDSAPRPPSGTFGGSSSSVPTRRLDISSAPVGRAKDASPAPASAPRSALKIDRSIFSISEPPSGSERPITRPSAPPRPDSIPPSATPRTPVPRAVEPAPSSGRESRPSVPRPRSSTPVPRPSASLAPLSTR